MCQKRNLEQVNNNNVYEQLLKITHNNRTTRQLKVSGKWSTDEEKYASELIFAFESGTLDDCEEGATLRSYLAKKLNCAPMRISKKFAGQGIGKLVYTSRANLANHFALLHPTVRNYTDELQATASPSSSAYSPVSVLNNDTSLASPCTVAQPPLYSPAYSSAYSPVYTPELQSDELVNHIPFISVSTFNGLSTAFAISSSTSSVPASAPEFSSALRPMAPSVMPVTPDQVSSASVHTPPMKRTRYHESDDVSVANDSISSCDHDREEEDWEDFAGASEAELWKSVLLYYCGSNA